MNDEQFKIITELLNVIVSNLEELNQRFEKYDAEEQISDEVLRESQDG